MPKQCIIVITEVTEGKLFAFENLTVLQLFKEFLAFYAIRNFIAEYARFIHRCLFWVR
jgi:hypothetical protein